MENSIRFIFCKLKEWKFRKRWVRPWVRRWAQRWADRRLALQRLWAFRQEARLRSGGVFVEFLEEVELEVHLH